MPKLTRLLVLGAHADDQIVGNPMPEIAGRQGSKVHVAVLNIAPNPASRAARTEEQEAYLQAMRTDYPQASFSHSILGLKLDTTHETCNGQPVDKQRIAVSNANSSQLLEELRRFKPTDVTVHAATDHHPDHERSYRLAMNAVRAYSREPNGNPVRVWFTHYWGHLQEPTHAILYDDSLLKERQAHLQCFPTQLAQTNFARAIAGSAIHDFYRAFEVTYGYATPHPFNNHSRIQYGDLTSVAVVRNGRVSTLPRRVYIAPAPRRRNA